MGLAVQNEMHEKLRKFRAVSTGMLKIENDKNQLVFKAKLQFEKKHASEDGRFQNRKVLKSIGFSNAK